MRRLGPLVLISVGIFIIVSGVLFYSYQQLLISPKAASLPPSLAGLPLEDSIFGRGSVAEVARLHGKDFPLTSGARGFYGPMSEMTLWTTGTASRIVASKMVTAMHDKIETNGSPFDPLSVLEHGGHKVYQLTGMGQRHFYFQAGPLVIWLAADPSLADQALEEVLEFYP